MGLDQFERTLGDGLGFVLLLAGLASIVLGHWLWTSAMAGRGARWLLAG